MRLLHLVKFLIASTIVFSHLSYAGWTTSIDDDLFSGGQKAVMHGTLNSPSIGLIFDCTKSDLSIAYVEQDTTSSDTGSFPVDLIIKVDGNSILKLDAALSRRNSQYLQIKSDNTDQINSILKQLQSAKSKVLVGVQTKDGGNQSSFSGSVSGSTVAVNRFVKACEIKL